MADKLPVMRRDLEFFPALHEGRQLVLIRDPLGLVKEGKAVQVGLYQIMILLDGTRSLVDLQMLLMRQGGGVLVGRDEVETLITHLDESFLLDSERFRRARAEIVDRFTQQSIRPCSHCGRAYPAEGEELRLRLDGILATGGLEGRLGGQVKAVVSPHIDLRVGEQLYARAYRSLQGALPARVILLGVGHQLADHLFCLTEKDFETPLGRVGCDRPSVRRLRASAGMIISPDDFPHRSEHSIEFQLLFLQHVLPENSFTILPVLCGFIPSEVPEYRRKTYLDKAGGFLVALREIILEQAESTLVVAGVDFSHIGLKFGHERPASHLEAGAKAHDQALLGALCRQDAESFWEESARVKDAFNVCGFSALTCLLEVLPPCKGEVLGYDMWHEAPTSSAVSFAAAVFYGE